MHLGVVDYGASNIHSVARALQSLGSKVSIVEAAKDVDAVSFDNFIELLEKGK